MPRKIDKDRAWIAYELALYDRPIPDSDDWDLCGRDANKFSRQLSAFYRQAQNICPLVLDAIGQSMFFGNKLTAIELRPQHIEVRFVKDSLAICLVASPSGILSSVSIGVREYWRKRTNFDRATLVSTNHNWTVSDFIDEHIELIHVACNLFFDALMKAQQEANK